MVDENYRLFIDEEVFRRLRDEIREQKEIISKFAQINI